MLSDTSQAGPFEILHAIRHWFGVRFDDYSQPYGKNQIGEAVLCVWCVSWWIGLVGMALWIISPAVAVLVSLPFALSASAILVENVIRKLSMEP